MGDGNLTRRNGREWALQLLFQLEANPGARLGDVFVTFWEQQWSVKFDELDEKRKVIRQKVWDRKTPDRVAPKALRDFSEELVRGVMAHANELDKKIEGYLQNWAMYRVAPVERNVLRLAFYELLFTDTPAPVVINEAIDLTKFFSTTEAGRFVNGILDKARKDMGR